ncbi:MAG TPA: dihydroneopterin aldolase [Xanthobacteraceae bacterium]|nr:dihydroneopterin aldolase [Xanthobacteraceae bacterium]
MSDKLFIDGLIFHAHHGVMGTKLKSARRFGSTLLSSLVAACATMVFAPVSHQSIVKIAGDVFCAAPYRLIEIAAGAVADALLDSSPQIAAVRVVVHKPHAIAATFADIRVTIERERGRPLPPVRYAAGRE